MAAVLEQMQEMVTKEIVMVAVLEDKEEEEAVLVCEVEPLRVQEVVAEVVHLLSLILQLISQR